MEFQRVGEELGRSPSIEQGVRVRTDTLELCNIFLGLGSTVNTNVLFLFQKWVFLTKFCFLATKGQINYHIRYPQVSIKHYSIYRTSIVYKSLNTGPKFSEDCWSKEAVAAIEKNQLFNLTQSFPLSGCQVMEENGINYTDCQRGLGFKSARERWWFLAVSNCMGGGIRLDYKITMTNGKTLWRRHFSANQIGSLGSNVMLLYKLGADSKEYFYVWRSCWSEKLTKLYNVIVGIFPVLGRFFLCVHFGIYGCNGVGCESLMDPGKVQTGLESPFGFAVTALQFLTALWFSYSTYHILQQHPEKQPFYSYFFPAFTFWALRRCDNMISNESIIMSEKPTILIFCSYPIPFIMLPLHVLVQFFCKRPNWLCS
uniref:Uncharacterized protein n=1 Tax=Callorhinchus milii TaxID=7868 RepID=A0A4W3IA98_CALMI